MIEIKRYIAVDGEEFATASECVSHNIKVCEEHCKIIYESTKRHINAQSILELARCNFCVDDVLMYMFIKDDMDLKTINDFIDTTDYLKCHLGEDMIGKKVAFLLCDNPAEGYYLGTKEQILAQYENALDVLFEED